MNKLELAEKILFELANSMDVDINTQIVSNCILGELYFQKEDLLNAKKHMEFVINAKINDDTLDYEKSVAFEILEKIKI